MLSVTSNPIYLETLLAVLGSSLAGAAAWLALRRRRQAEAAAQTSSAEPLVAALALYVITFTALSFARFDAYNMGMLDLGGIDQAIWNTSQGDAFKMTGFESGDMNRLGVHVELIFFIVAPVFHIWNSVKALLVLQSLCLALGCLPLYALAARRLGPRSALVVAIAYLLYPPLHYANLSDFHADSLALPLLALCVWSYERKRPLLFAISAGLALSSKEYVALLIAALGVHALLSGRRLWGGLTLAAAAAWFSIAMLVIIPAFSAGQQAYYLDDHYAEVGGRDGLSGLAKHALLHPIDTLTTSLSPRKLGYLVLLLTPLWWLPLASPSRLLVTLPMLAALLLHPGVADIRNHHSAILVPFIFWAGLAALERWPQQRQSLLAAWLMAALTSAVLFGPSPLAWKWWAPNEWQHHGHPHNLRHTRHDGVLDRVAAQVPAHRPGSTSVQLGAHFSHRPVLYTFPVPFVPRLAAKPAGPEPVQPEWALVDIFEVGPQDWLPAEPVLGVRRLLGNPDWVVTAHEDGVLLFQASRHAGTLAPLEISRDRYAAELDPLDPELSLPRRVSIRHTAPDRVRVEIDLPSDAPYQPKSFIAVKLLRGDLVTTRIVDWWTLPELSSESASIGAHHDVIEAELPAGAMPARVVLGRYRVSERFALATDADQKTPWWSDFVIWERELGTLPPSGSLHWQADAP